MPKILYITNQISGPGGLERVLSIKTSYINDKLGYDVHILTLNQNSSDFFYEFNENIKFHNVITKGNFFKYMYSYRQGIKNIVNNIKPDIILVCDDGLKGLLLPIIIGKNRPMIYERHVSKNIEIKNEDSTFVERIINSLKFKLMNIGGGFYNYFVVLTHGNLSEWHLKNLKVIPNPLTFYPEISSTLKNKKVIAVGKHSYQKGFDRLLNSWKLVVKKHPEWVLDIYGTINKSEGLIALAHSLEIIKNVNFYPPVKNIATKYQEASIYVMSSRYEGFGMVLTEAMAFGVPCVSFDCPHGPSDIISNNVNGILIENNNITALADGINNLIENDNLRSAMGAKAKNDVSRYMPDKIALEWDNLFKSLILNN